MERRVLSWLSCSDVPNEGLGGYRCSRWKAQVGSALHAAHRSGWSQNKRPRRVGLPRKGSTLTPLSKRETEQWSWS